MNTLRAAYDLSKAMQTSHLVKVPAGMFAVVAESPDYCSVTDAMLPNPSRSIVQVCGSRRVAEYHARKLNAAVGDDYDLSYAVLPKPAVMTKIDWSQLPADDEMPF